MASSPAGPGTAPDSTTIPGWTISPPRLLEWRDVEEEARRSFMANAAEAVSDQPRYMQEIVLRVATENLLAFPLRYNSPMLNQWMLSASALPFLLWLSLRVRRPDVTPDQASEILAKADDLQVMRIRVSVLEGFGFESEAKKKEQQAISPSIGTPSTSVSSPPSPPDSA